MLKKINEQKVLELFFEYPTTVFYIREIARLLKISPPMVSINIRTLLREGYIVDVRTGITNEVRANINNDGFLEKKRVFNLESLYKCGLVGHLNKEYGLSPIAVFGSYSRGEDTEKSDIDIAIITEKHKSLNLDNYEKTLKRRITVHEVDLKKVSKEFKNNLGNGIVLKGYLELT